MSTSPPGSGAKSFSLPAGPWIGFVAVLALFTVLIGIKGELGTFLSLGNLRVLLHEGTVPAVVALGMLLVLIGGGIDLSVGATVALVTVVTMRVYTAMYTSSGPSPTNSFVAIVVGVMAGGLCGLINGVLVTKLQLPPFVATLGMFGIARGVAVWLAARTTLPFPLGGTPEWVDTVGRVSLTNPGLWSLVLLAILTAVLLKLTVFGRHLYAVGSNEATARLCGVNVTRTKLLVYTLAGLLTGWAGVILFAHSNSGNPTLGEQLELDVITAVVIGGASLSGGRGTVVGAMLGVLILILIKNGVSLFNVPVEMQYVLIGALLIANVSLNRWRQKGSR
ncbi:ribose abc transporter permease : Monosaccharide-transporting ATPase OS=Opitutus terrae (strain DSM 11246 / PB90-1) GN=Oter_3322 PE=4 SV=1: BPD_transp_2 [Gemmata massiliana]|uniref:ABC transporter permease n=1 Tax=Gemmata massiliana TaxID=1210884 RepID=A0A6P2D430_9BACT|nr:ABC transporter permease [Gemmata massiliana]VTR95843.1 ribose abc transporter permease : Monosaccharide-transporting ATPase OS=Opitutus terrae (strain DSM 11246 / PB90-1) GN=Oter_3322 PE=4 SV=1: BPD_transp_2 [Gemmata massiliana]